jgi:hypothetical protein
MAGIDQREHAAWLREASAAVDVEVARLTAGLDDAALARKPPDGGWSIAEVLEHLCVSADSYLDLLAREIGRANGTPAAAPGTVWKPSLLGGLLVRSLQPASTRKVPAPKMYRPAATPRPNVVSEFLRRQATLLELLERGAGLDWRRVRTSSPVSRLIRINLGDAYTILVVHAQRHAGQIARVRAAIGAGAA